MFGNVFAGKTVLVTGHLGFKGSWLSLWLTLMGAKVTGFSLEVPSEPCNFISLALNNSIDDVRGDVRDKIAVKCLVNRLQPDFVFHLAAQSLVSRSIGSPLETFETNAIGSAVILDCLRELSKKVVVLMVTSDKVYQNQEWHWGYRESDPLGGKDPYSASKAMTELAIRSYLETFFDGPEGLVRVGIGRAGNVVGGGDWAANRLVPDCIRAWSTKKTVNIRNPGSTRPWQHVLEPLSGYLVLASRLWDSSKLHGEAFNFGPNSTTAISVASFISLMANTWGNALWNEGVNTQLASKESGLLQLNCDKASANLNWRPVLTVDGTIEYTVDWYKGFYNRARDLSIRDITIRQIESYCDDAASKGLEWARTDD